MAILDVYDFHKNVFPCLSINVLVSKMSNFESFSRHLIFSKMEAICLKRFNGVVSSYHQNSLLVMHFRLVRQGFRDFVYFRFLVLCERRIAGIKNGGSEECNCILHNSLGWVQKLQKVLQNCQWVFHITQQSCIRKIKRTSNNQLKQLFELKNIRTVSIITLKPWVKFTVINTERILQKLWRTPHSR